jgi:hypothetical protein
MRARFATALGLLALAAAPAAILVAGAPVAGAAPSPDLSASATLVTVRLSGLPVPGELALGSTSATAGPGATSQASASWLRSVGTSAGLDALLSQPAQTPAGQVDARSPGGPPQQRQELAPGSGMSATAGSSAAKSEVSVVGLTPPADQPAAPGVLPGLLPGLLPSLPVLPALPVVPGELTSAAGLVALVDAHAITSGSELSMASGAVGSAARTSATGLTLLGGLVTIDSVEAHSSATSSGVAATADGASTLTGVTIAGQRLPDGATSVPQPVADALRTAGITVTMAPADRQVSGGAGAMRTGSLGITVDTNLVRGAGGLLPTNLLGTLNPVLGLAPRLEFVIGDAQASAKAAPPAPGTTPPATGTPGLPGFPSFPRLPGFQLPAFPGFSLPPYGTTPGGFHPATRPAAQTPAASVAPANAASIAALAPMPRILLASGLAVAAVVGWGLQRGGGFLLRPAGACPHGLATGIPDLRQGLPARSATSVPDAGSQAASQRGSSLSEKFRDAADEARKHLKRHEDSNEE